MARKRKQLGSEARAVLALLPPTQHKPDFSGAYVGDMALDLLERQDSIARCRIRALLHEIDIKLGNLRRHHAQGPVGYGQKVSYSIPLPLWPKAEKCLRHGFATRLKP